MECGYTTRLVNKGKVKYQYECWMSTFFFFQAEDGIRDVAVTGVQTCALPISFFQDGFDQSRCVRARARGRTGRHGSPGGRANGRTRPCWPCVAFGTRHRNLRELAAATEAGAGAGPLADSDGRALGAYGGGGSDWPVGGLEVAERLDGSGEESGRHPDGNARRAWTDTVCRGGNRIERESGEIPGRTCEYCDLLAAGDGQATVAHGIVGAVAAGIRARLQSVRA